MRHFVLFCSRHKLILKYVNVLPDFYPNRYCQCVSNKKVIANILLTCSSLYHLLPNPSLYAFMYCHYINVIYAVINLHVYGNYVVADNVLSRI